MASRSITRIGCKLQRMKSEDTLLFPAGDRTLAPSDSPPEELPESESANRRIQNEKEASNA